MKDVNQFKAFIWTNSLPSFLSPQLTDRRNLPESIVHCLPITLTFTLCSGFRGLLQAVE
jgi:hypothetical protein